jgi:hypothetical protein
MPLRGTISVNKISNAGIFSRRDAETLRNFFSALSATPREILTFGLLIWKSKTVWVVIPAQAGIQYFQHVLDPGFHRGGGIDTFYGFIIKGLQTTVS